MISKEASEYKWRPGAGNVTCEQRRLEFFHQLAPLQFSGDATERLTLPAGYLEALVDPVQVVPACRRAAAARMPICEVFGR